MAFVLETYGAETLMLTGAGIVLNVLLVLLIRKIRGRPLDKSTLTVVTGIVTFSLALAICGAMIGYAFHGTTGVNRIIGNVFTMAAGIMCLGIGVRSYRNSRRMLLGIVD